MLRDCSNKAEQEQEITADEPEVLFIGHTEMQEAEDGWEKAAGCRRPRAVGRRPHVAKEHA